MTDDRRMLRRDEIRPTETKQRTERTTDQPMTTTDNIRPRIEQKLEEELRGGVVFIFANTALYSSWKKGGTMPFIFDTVMLRSFLHLLYVVISILFTSLHNL
ncbi:uncharacterized protein LOC123200584 [Mangifera indica]|uniref:uncharacterized protein LOC123200584 n=1 Tax=Mangifera indica TaxID=29780 RepID=UPI001CFBE869|nr:uncharacterized protein LOC123200584 [Mangifera indica]